MDLTEKEDSFLVSERLVGIKDVLICDYIVKRKDDQLILYAYRNRVGKELFYRLMRGNHVIDSYAASDYKEAIRMFEVSMEFQNISKC